MAVDKQQLLPAPGGGNNKGVVVPKHGNKTTNPLFLIIIGALALLLGISTSMFDIQASESLVTGSQMTSFVPNWQLLAQIPQIVSGRELPANVAAAYYTGWVVEMASLILVGCFDLAIDGILHAPGWVISSFRWGIYGIALFDVITNFMYMPGITAWFVRLFVSVLIAVSSFFFPIIGVFCMERGVKSW